MLLVRFQVEVRNMLLATGPKMAENLAELFCSGWKAGMCLRLPSSGWECSLAILCCLQQMHGQRNKLRKELSGKGKQYLMTWSSEDRTRVWWDQCLLKSGVTCGLTGHLSRSGAERHSGRSVDQALLI